MAIEEVGKTEKGVKNLTIVMSIILVLLIIVFIFIFGRLFLQHTSQNVNTTFSSDELKLKKCLEENKFSYECSILIMKVSSNDFCSKFNGDVQDNCFFIKAGAEGISLCDKISDEDIKIKCISQYNQTVMPLGEIKT